MNSSIFLLHCLTSSGSDLCVTDTHRRNGCLGNSYVPPRLDLAHRCTASSHSFVRLGNSAENNQAWAWKKIKINTQMMASVSSVEHLSNHKVSKSKLKKCSA